MFRKDKFMRKLRAFKRKFIKPVFKMLFMRLIVFYQRNLSRHTCLYEPTCSEYTKRCINNKGVVLGILYGLWRILRCNPFSKGGYDPAPEKYFRLKWVL